jgi:hypothetical protein
MINAQGVAVTSKLRTAGRQEILAIIKRKQECQNAFQQVKLISDTYYRLNLLSQIIGSEFDE